MNKKRFVSPDDVETLSLTWGRIQWLSEPRVTGSQTLVTGIVELEPGQGHERHNHPGCDEIIYVMKGQGEQFMEEADGTVETRHVNAGELIFIPADLYHGTLNTGSEIMRLLVVYQTAGPEAVLRELPDCRILPPRSNL